MIISGAENIYPVGVEQVIAGLGGIAEAKSEGPPNFSGSATLPLFSEKVS
jgi:hypothetical protein